jgi:hypothetical protein
MKDSARLHGGVLFLFMSIAVAVSGPAAQGVPPRPAVPVEAIAAIVDAFRSHSVVAVEAGHGEERGYAFGLSLVRDPKVAAVVNDIVIEEGSARYQDVADRFIRGDEVSDESLSQVWRNTTQPGPGLDRPWEEFFRAVRTVNVSVPRERQLRVLLGDPPIDWNGVHNAEDHRKWIEMRDTLPADVIQREVLAKGRRALVMYGQMHFQRKNLLANYESKGLAETIVSRLERTTATKVFTIWTSTNVEKLQADVASWRVPSIALVRGTVLGAADFTFYYPFATPRFSIQDGAPIPRDQWRTLRAEDQFDAVLYPGPQPSVIVPVSPARCTDTADIEMHLRRMMLAGLPPSESDRLKQYCASLAPR